MFQLNTVAQNNEPQNLFGIQNIGINKAKSGIKIKESQKGTFTKYCNGKVTQECINKGKNSPNKAIRKKAVFAQNSRHWSKR